jgi:uncharacterized membrane protein
LTALSPGPGATAAALQVRRAVLANIALLAVCVAIAALRTGTWPHNLILAGALLVPLTLPLSGIVQHQRRTFAWATLCVTPYFIYGATEVIANPPVRVLAGAILIASLALFVSLVAYLRVTRQRPTGAQAS